MASVSSASGTLAPPSHASDEHESVYLSRARTLHWVRLGIATTIFGSAAAVIGCESTALHRYKETAGYSSVGLPLWPLNLDVRQTNALVACGAVIAFQAVVYIVAALVPSPHSRARLLNFLASAVALAGLITAVVGVAFSIYLPSASRPDGFTTSETLHTWTCKWQSLGDTNATSSTGQALTAPTNFSRICVESRAGFVLLGLLIGLEIIMGAAAAAGYWFEVGVLKQRKVYQLQGEQFVMESKNP